MFVSAIEKDYNGPNLEDGKVTLEFMQHLIKTYKEQGKLHRKHAYKVGTMALPFILFDPSGGAYSECFPTKILLANLCKLPVQPSAVTSQNAAANLSLLLQQSKIIKASWIKVLNAHFVSDSTGCETAFHVTTILSRSYSC